MPASFLGIRNGLRLWMIENDRLGEYLCHDIVAMNKRLLAKENNSADVIRFRDHVPHKVLNRNLKFNYFSPRQHHAYYAEHV